MPKSSRGEITSQHPRGGIPRRPQLLRQLGRVDRVVRLARRHLVHEVAADAVHARVLDDHRVAAGARFRDVRAVAVRVAGRAANRRAHVLDGGVGLLAEPHQEHGFDGREVPVGFGVVAFGDALAVGAVEQVVPHDPAAAFAVGGLGGLAVGIGAGGPGGFEPGGVVGVLGKADIPGVLGEGGVPCRA